MINFFKNVLFVFPLWILTGLFIVSEIVLHVIGLGKIAFWGFAAYLLLFIVIFMLKEISSLKKK